MKEFIEKLNHYWETHEGTEPEEGYRWLEPEKDGNSSLMGEIWDKCFVGTYGWNPEARVALREAGYRCHVWERDSFGILIAGISRGGKAISIG